MGSGIETCKATFASRLALSAGEFPIRPMRESLKPSRTQDKKVVATPFTWTLVMHTLEWLRVNVEGSGAAVLVVVRS